MSHGAADVDGRLQAGDQLLEVDGANLVGLSQERYILNLHIMYVNVAFTAK